MLRRLASLTRPTLKTRPAPSQFSVSPAFAAHRLAPLALLLLATWGLVRPATVQAQTAVQPAVVLDFATDGNIDPIQGRKAADAVAVELQRSGDYEIVTRQQVEDAVRTQPGLRPPFNEPTQQRLAGVVGARSVFSGRVVRIELNNRRAARVQMEVRQLDAATGDFINGTQISEVTNDKLQEIDNDVLIDEAINKAAFAAVRAMKQTRLPEGTVLNVTREDIELNLGARNGVAVGQRYTVLRDVFNRAINRVERVKVGEVTIRRVEADQSTAVLSAGGQAGVRTQDKVRQIYVPNALAFVGTASGSSSPVTAPPPATRRSNSIMRKGGNALIGGAALLGLIALAGFGGGDNGSPNEAPKSVVAAPVRTSASGASAVAAIRINFREGLPGVLTPRDLLAGYLIYRSTSPNFAASSETLIDFIEGRQTTYTDSSLVSARRTITIEEDNPEEGESGTGRLVVNTTSGGTGANSIDQDDDTITINVTREPLVLGVQYYYRVARILARTTQISGDGEDDPTTVELQPVISSPSGLSGGATAIPTPLASSITTSNNLDAFVVTLGPSIPGTGTPPVGATSFAPGEIDQITVQVSTSSSFPEELTFTQTLPNPGVNGEGNIVLNLGDIRVRNFAPGDSVFVRVGLRNSTDNPGATILSNPVLLSDPAGADSISSRFISNGATGRRRGGQALPSAPRGSQGRFGGGRRAPGHILRPR
jgi:hypothetical protein